MGQAVPIIGAIGKLDCCSTWAKVVCNACKCHSSCLGDCCDLEIETQEVAANDDSDVELEIDDCCNLKA